MTLENNRKTVEQTLRNLLNLRPGDKLDIKFLILYIASRLIEPVGIDVLTDLALCDDGVDYFSFSECLNELVAIIFQNLSRCVKSSPV